MRRYWSLLGLQLRTSTLLAMQYRVDFLLDMFIEVVWAATSLVPLWVVFRASGSMAGWSYAEALVVTGWFTMLQGVLEGAVNPSLTTVVEHVRQGTLDFILVKPADAQFLVSTARFQPSRLINAVTASCIFAYAFHRMGRFPGALDVAAAVALFTVACVLLYSIWILTVSAAFYVVRIDNLTYLFTAVFDAARWPATVFKGALRLFFTVVLPLAIMTTFPAEALLGRIAPLSIVEALAAAIVFATISRVAWLRSMRRYTSASS